MSYVSKSSPPIAASRGGFLFRAIPGRSALVWVIIFSVAINSLLLILPFYSIEVFDRVINSGSIETLIGLTCLAVVALGFSAAFDSNFPGQFGFIAEEMRRRGVPCAAIASRT